MIPTVHIPSSSHPWSTVYTVAAERIPESWMLAGGLMVQLHAIMGGLTIRPTTDADLLVGLRPIAVASPDCDIFSLPVDLRRNPAR